MAPRYACEPFCVLADVLTAQCGCEFDPVDDADLINDLIDEASDMLYVLSGGRVTGRCTRTVWPVRVGDTACWPDSEMNFSWETYDSVDSIPLPGPDTSVSEVKIDGSVLDVSKYKLLNGSKLFRADGLAWPSSNDLTKASTERGTFTITVTFGHSIREIAKRASIELTCQLARSTQGISRLRGVVSANIQGVSVQLDPEEIAQLGLPEVARFMDFHAPRGIAVLGVWSPELSHGWRLHTVTAGSGA